MAKKSNVSLAAATLADEAFVHGSDVKTSRVSKTSKRQDATAKRRMTIYIPEALAMQLERYAVDNRATVSGVVETALTKLVARARPTT